MDTLSPLFVDSQHKGPVMQSFDVVFFGYSDEQIVELLVILNAMIINCVLVCSWSW